jgi:hypothetical protein
VLAELDKNGPAFVSGAVTGTLARANQQPSVGEGAFLGRSLPWRITDADRLFNGLRALVRPYVEATSG